MLQTLRILCSFKVSAPSPSINGEIFPNEKLEIDSKDTSKDGKIDFEEYIASELESVKDDPNYENYVQEAKLYFDELDTNKSGTLGLLEFQQFYTMLDNLDNKKDGLISYDCINSQSNEAAIEV